MNALAQTNLVYVTNSIIKKSRHVYFKWEFDIVDLTFSGYNPQQDTRTHTQIYTYFILTRK